MQQLKGQKVLIGALAVLACSVDPTGNEGIPTAIKAQPDVVYVTQGDSQPVIVTVIDEDGQVLEADITHANVGSGIQVVEDENFKRLQSENQIGRESRFFVKGVDLTATTFTVSALGLEKNIQVTSIPGTLSATISNPTPALGDTISITAPTGTFFTDASVLTLAGAEPVVVTRDAATIVFIPFPNVRDPVVVSDVGVTSNPNLTFTLATPDTVITDSITNAGPNVTPLAPALGTPVTIILPGDLRVIPESLVQSGVGADTVPRGVFVAGSEVQPQAVSVLPDSVTITLIPPPNADSTIIVPGVIHTRLPQYPLELETSAKITTPVIDSVPATLSNAAPALAELVTLTRTDAAFTFDADATVAPTTLETSVAADGSSISFVPFPGSAGNVSVDGVTIGGFSLALPATGANITVPGEVPAIAGTESPATAPAIAIPAPGGTTRFLDDATFIAADITEDGGVTSQFYSITLGAATTMTISISSGDAGPDLDGVICTDGTCADPNLQDFSLASAAHDESAEVTLPAGTHTLAVVNFDGVPTDFIYVTITR